jgi:phage terminase small subunit
MSTFTSKMLAYCQHRADGLTVGDAARAAGYLPSSAAVTASRLEPRADVQAEIKRLKRQGKSKAAPAAVGGDSLPDRHVSPLAPWGLKDKYSDPLSLLLDVSNNPKAPIGIRIQCAKDALPYCHARVGESGKKQKAQEAAENAAGGSRSKKSRFATQPTPLRRVA